MRDDCRSRLESVSGVDSTGRGKYLRYVTLCKLTFVCVSGSRKHKHQFVNNKHVVNKFVFWHYVAVVPVFVLGVIVLEIINNVVARVATGRLWSFVFSLVSKMGPIHEGCGYSGVGIG